MLRRIKTKKKTIILDPGHGGRDSGAVNTEFNILEKSINLTVARLVRRYLMRHYPEIKVRMTRYFDQSVSLKSRVLFANCLKAPLISIHCNAVSWRLNYGLEPEIFKYKESDLFLAKTIYTAFLEEVEFRGDITVISRGIKQKGFYVLKNTENPACLIELGFISDSEEALFLDNVKNQRLLAKGIAEGIVSYFL